MSQSKRNSFIEAVVNTFIGFMTTLIVSPFIYWVCDVKISYPKMTWVTVAFTIVSVIRNYIIRRWFNKSKKEEEVQTLIFDLCTLPKQKPVDKKLSYIELHKKYLKLCLLFDAEEYINADDTTLGTKIITNDFTVYAERRSVVSCEVILTDTNFWKLIISVNGMADDISIFFRKNKRSEAIRMAEIINNWIINK